MSVGEWGVCGRVGCLWESGMFVGDWGVCGRVGCLWENRVSVGLLPHLIKSF